MSDMPISRQLAMQAEAAKRLLSHLREEGHGDDAELLVDAIEGETSLHEAISVGIDQIDECDILIVGLKAKETELSTRRANIEKRKESIRAAIEQAMLVAEQKSITAPSATVFLSARKPGLIIENEADIPSRFFVEQERPAPKLDKKALAAALANKEDVPGAALDNGSVSLTIRRQ